MYCSYHTSSMAKVQCTSCARPLCPACDHRIRGYAYCQDCIVMGIESLSRPRHYTEGASKRKARIAALCALLPGMGAVYNRQNIKAVVHFVAIVGLFQLTELHLFEGMFALAGVAFYAYTVIDAYRTAQLIAQGESAAGDEQRFKRSLAKRAPIFGALFIAVGLLAVIQMARPFGIFIPLARTLPVALIFLGGYLLTRYFKRTREEDYTPDHSRRQPYAVIPGHFADTKQEGARQHSNPFGQR